MKELTDRQRELLGFIEEHVETHGFPPSIREMGDQMGIRSTNGVNDHLKALERKGYIARGAGLKSRAISLLAGGSGKKPQEPVLAVPVLGRVAAGAPVLSEEHIEDTVYVGSSLAGGRAAGRDVFALRVRGESMIEKGILDGDIVFVRAQRTASNGQTVVAMVDGEATVKTFRRSRNTIRLEPANSDMSPIVIKAQDFKPTVIIGIVTGVFRQI